MAAKVTGVCAFLRRHAHTMPDRVALVDGARQVTYGELDLMVERLAASFTGLGLRKFARVALYLDKSLEMAASFLAIGAAGLIAVPINPKLKPIQVQHILADSAAEMLVTTPYRWSQLEEVTDPAILRSLLLTGESLPQISGRAAFLWQDFAQATTGGALHRVIDIDPAAILYTSGSTGMPKGVTISHRNFVAGAESVNGYLETNQDDTILALLPFSFDAGLSQLTTALEAGARLVLHNHLRAQEVAEICSREGVTSLTGVPPLWIQLAAVPWSEQARHTLRLFANTGGHMPRSLLGQLRDLFPKAKPYLMYGLTEAFRSTYLDPAQIDKRIDSIGKAIPNAEILVVHPDGTPCDPGETGELVHRGAHVTLGYWNAPEKTAERFRPLTDRPATGLVEEMAVWSGDLVRTDEDGYLYFVGRRDEMIKSSGYRISPNEVETVLYQSEHVAEAAVIGVADPALGQAVVALVVPRTAEFDVTVLVAHCGRQLPGYMVPQIVIFGELPRSPNGKINRTALPDLYQEKIKERGAA